MFADAERSTSGWKQGRLNPYNANSLGLSLTLHKPNLVPYRQCKLTELLFSNSFPNHHPSNQPTHPTHHRNPQKAIMVVTADPVGDFNATSQILRYSALAREVTVPRIPSVSSMILAGITTTNIAVEGSQRTPSGTSLVSQTSPLRAADESMVDLAISEVARLTEEIEILNIKLAEEERRRQEAEEGWQRAEDRAESVEAEVRAECWTEVETKMTEERRRWVNAFGEEADRCEEHLDRKLDILSKSEAVPVHEDPEDREEWVQTLERENEELRRRMEAMERLVQCRSPTKTSKYGPRSQRSTMMTTSVDANFSAEMIPLASLRSPLQEVSQEEQREAWREDQANTPEKGRSFLNSIGSMKISSPSPPPSATRAGKSPKAMAATPGTAGKKMRKLTARKWDLMDENELDEYGVF